MIKNWWRKLWRDPYRADLRLIRPRFRHLYEADMSRTCGHALGALSRAYHAGHFYPRSYLTPKEKAARI